MQHVFALCSQPRQFAGLLFHSFLLDILWCLGPWEQAKGLCCSLPSEQATAHAPIQEEHDSSGTMASSVHGHPPSCTICTEKALVPLIEEQSHPPAAPTHGQGMQLCLAHSLCAGPWQCWASNDRAEDMQFFPPVPCSHPWHL